MIHGTQHPHHDGVSAVRKLLTSRLWVGLRGIALLLFLGSAGYWCLGRLHYAGVLQPRLEEHWSVLDCVYMTVITFSTIGYGEVFSLDQLPVVRVFTIGLILTGMILVAFSVSSATAFFVNGDLQRLLLRRRMMKQISRLQGHHVVCGCGVTGHVILDELIATGQTVVVIDSDPTRLADYAGESQVLTLEGDATTDEVLLEAGIERATGLAAALPSDKDNLFLIISARQLAPQLRIVSAASSQSLREKLLRAGADGVVSSSFIGGLRLASELVRPAVVSFLDEMLRKTGGAVRFAQITVGQGCAGKALGEVDTAQLPILAVRTGSGEFVFTPPPDYVLAAADELVTMGEVARVLELEARAGDPDGATFLGAGENGEESP